MTTDRRTETADLVQRAYLLLLRALAREHAGSPDTREVGEALHRVSEGNAELCLHLVCDGTEVAFLTQVRDPLTDGATTLAHFNIVPADDAALPH